MLFPGFQCERNTNFIFTRNFKKNFSIHLLLIFKIHFSMMNVLLYLCQLINATDKIAVYTVLVITRYLSSEIS